jgi:hypothetical protein
MSYHIRGMYPSYYYPGSYCVGIYRRNVSHDLIDQVITEAEAGGWIDLVEVKEAF